MGMGLAFDSLKLADRDRWRDSDGWIRSPDKGAYHLPGQWVQKKVRGGELVMERHYILTVNLATSTVHPDYCWYTRQVAYPVADVGDSEIVESLHRTDRLDGKSPEELIAFFAKNDYERVH